MPRMTKNVTQTVFQDTRSGRWVSQDYARKHPKTVAESVIRRPRLTTGRDASGRFAPVVND